MFLLLYSYYVLIANWTIRLMFIILIDENREYKNQRIKRASHLMPQDIDKESTLLIQKRQLRWEQNTPRCLLACE